MATSSARVRRLLRQNIVQTAQREAVRAKAVGYLRVSTEEQAQSGFGLDAQEDAVRKYADAVSLDLVDVITDAGVSGTTRPSDRPGFAQVLQLAERRAFSVLLVKRFDRLARNIALAVVTSNDLDKVHGVTIRSVTEGIDTGSPAGKMIFGLLAAMAEGERDAIVERTKGGRIEKARQGGFAGGRVPIGYARDGKKGLTLDADRAEIVRRIFEENGKGRTLQAIADVLNAEGILTARGKRWHPSTVSYVLGNPVYFGTVEYLAVSGGVVTHINRPGDHPRLIR
ncbi:recombinase family protein [Methylobacterium soli]|uniref:Recombinase family protein n=1 Tax=Methylobacterium soli TaxID=553447 RepID=A0A6L3SQ04_9HYPH|nr:recombinase family protein [Methylobacterium soli]KAB1072526.1 recombinase family protein [Methylobacterium soli]GJE43841.1 hypothetical protein AEGHOMDF_3020 [Methylobacterium soli]